MTTTEFNILVDKLVNKIKSTLIKKQDEYNLTDDRLSFFKKAATLSGKTAHETLMGFTVKQIVSEFEMTSASKQFTEELWLEKIIDIICYQFLLYGLLTDTHKFKKVKINESSR